MSSTRHRSASAALFGVLLLLVSACSTSTSSGNQNKTLIVVTSFQIARGIDPARTQSITASEVISQMYQTLLTFDQKDPTKLDPSLAASYVASPDGLSVTLKLRHDVRFSDGSPMTSADVAFSINRTVNVKGDIAARVPNLSASAPDAYTVVVTSSKPNPAIAYALAYPLVVILNSKVVQAHGGSDAVGADKTDTAEAFLNQQSAGSGPYVLVSIDPQSQVVLKSNPNYWGKQPAYTKVVFQNETANTQELDVQKGPNTISLDLSSPQVSTLDKSKVNVVSAQALDVFVVGMNVDPTVSSASSNLDFRRAVQYGIDYQTLLSIVGSGSVRAASFLAPGIAGALPPNEAISRDVAKAKSFLSQSGETNPTIALDYPSDDTPLGVDYSVLAQSIQANLKEIGITVNLVPSPSVQFTSKWRGGKSQMFVRELGGGTYDPALALLYQTLLGPWMGQKKPSAQVVAIVAQINAATDAAQRTNLYMQYMRIMNDEAILVPLFYGPLHVVGSKGVGGLNLSGLQLVDLSKLT